MSRLQSHLPPDLVVFDLDGTLHDTFRWWSPVIRAGLRRFAEQHQLAIEMPSDAVAEAVVGMRDSGCGRRSCRKATSIVGKNCVPWSCRWR